MPAAMQHDLDKILAKLLWGNRGLGSNPAQWEAYLGTAAAGAAKGTRPTSSWPVFDGGEPNEPDNVITVYETTPVSHARIQITGEDQQHYGFTVRVRGRTKELAKAKARAIKHDFDQLCTDQQVTLDSTQYFVPCIAQCTMVPFGWGSSDQRHYLVNLNCLAVVLAYPLTYTPTLAGVLAFYNTEELSGDRADATGNGNTLTASGSVPSAAGVIGNAASVAPSAGAMLTRASVLASGAFTYAGFFRVVAVENLAALFGQNHNSFLVIRVTGTEGQPELGFTFDGFDGTTSIEAPTPVAADTWHHVAVTSDGSTLRLYVDGALVNSGASVPNYSGVSVLRVGSTPTTGEINFRADLLGVWPRALSLAEVQELYNGGAGLAYPF